ncbi:MAG: galactokinase [Henriciella sp.]
MTITDRFCKSFARKPVATAKVYGRVNLIGEHTDYNGGAVLPAAITRSIHVGVAPNDSHLVAIKSARFEHKHERLLGDPKRGDWTDYAMGAVSKAEALGWISGGIDLFIESDVPDGAGVSSSAALITAILRASAEMASVQIDPVEVAKHARAVENDYIGMPCGIMDQMAVGLSDPGSALALDCHTLNYDVIDIPDTWSFVTLHSGVRRELADGRYKARFEECAQAAERLGAEELCLLDQSQRSGLASLPENLRKRAQHVTSEHNRVLAATAAMKAADINMFARLMSESHYSYSQDFEASTPAIDALIDDAVISGAKGARLTGGGFGGCIVVLLERSQEARWLELFLARHPESWRV